MSLDFSEKIVELGGYAMQQICNMDGTVLFWRKEGDRTYVSKKEKYFLDSKPWHVG